LTPSSLIVVPQFAQKARCGNEEGLASDSRGGFHNIPILFQPFDGEFERSGMGKTKGLVWAIGDIFTAENFTIALIASLIGYVLVEFLRKKLWGRNSN
jgi:hypothetical protein